MMMSVHSLGERGGRDTCTFRECLILQGGTEGDTAVHFERLRPAFILVTVLTVLHTLGGRERDRQREGMNIRLYRNTLTEP